MSKHFDLASRGMLEAYLKENMPVATIAAKLNFSRQAVYYELNRRQPIFKHNGKTIYADYNALYAESDAIKKQASRGRQSKLTARKSSLIRERLEAGDSPEYIVHKYQKRLKISTSTLYNYINFGRITGISSANLEYQGKRFKRSIIRKVNADRQTKDFSLLNAPGGNVKSIDRRSKRINGRIEFGHWEIDGVESKKSTALVYTFVERRTRFTVAYWLPDKRAETSALTIKHFLSDFAGTVRSITTDRGTEFTNSFVETIFMQNHVVHYLADPNSAWQRGSNENGNRRFRKHFPKGTDFASVSHDDILLAVSKLNDYPFKLHNYRTALHEFKKAIQRRNLSVKNDFLIPK